MFHASRYQEEILRLTDQDKRKSRGDSRLPDWYAKYFTYLMNVCQKMLKSLIVKV